MLHSNRIWCVQPIDSAEELAKWLAEYTMCCCCGFKLDGYLFLNDSTSADGAQEYAVCKEPVGPDQPHRQIESITFGWCTYERSLRFIREILAGQYDNSDFAQPVRPSLQTPAEHGRCHFCA